MSSFSDPWWYSWQNIVSVSRKMRCPKELQVQGLQFWSHQSSGSNIHHALHRICSFSSLHISCTQSCILMVSDTLWVCESTLQNRNIAKEAYFKVITIALYKKYYTAWIVSVENLITALSPNNWEKLKQLLPFKRMYYYANSTKNTNSIRGSIILENHLKHAKQRWI